MPTAKQVADLITLTRALLPFIFIWVGVARGAEALAAAGLLLLVSWISDVIDGPIARRSRVYFNSWLGDHDLEIDMAVAVGVLVFMLSSGYIHLVIGVGYLGVWVIIFLRWGLHRSPGMLFQAPVYAGMIWLCLANAFPVGLTQIAFILGVLIITWPRFPQAVVPGFLAGFSTFWNKIR
jgi:phosphatidylglycerophosphate synthase